MLIVKTMFITPADETICGRIGTDRYNKLSLILCTAGILVIGLVSAIYEHIGEVSFGM